ncbi:MAG: PSD1 and planctomycete cytochrome C domain-containing protein, partial [Verrucomicrobiota bacterium]
MKSRTTSPSFSPLYREFRWAAAGLLVALSVSGAERKIDFNRDIRPIFSENCYACHGPDHNKRKAGLRLDRSEEPFKLLDSGKTAIVPGDLSKSELVRRITTNDPDDRMPPPDFRKQLNKSQVELLSQWVRQGAPWKGHWAYIAPERPEIPKVKNKTWPRNAIDHFILARLEKEGLKPSREADKTRLIRRVTLDLTGLPPTIAEVDAFLADKSVHAYEKVLDRLLASAAFGERMALFWLDVARFADTNGYHIDNNREIWKWREWVINAFNQNMPFDEFTIEQLAGDLLPNPTVDQKIATGFNRNEMVNFEGGADPDEYASKYVIGRVDTTSKTFLGTTFACAECHDHKYDPISQREFYQFYAFFNTVAEKGLDGQKESPAPRLSIPSPEQQAASVKLNHETAALETEIKRLLETANPESDSAQAGWEKRTSVNAMENWTALLPETFTASSGATLTRLDDLSVLAAGTNAEKEIYEVTFKTAQKQITGLRLDVFTNGTALENGPGRSTNGNFVLTAFEAEARSLGGENDKPAPLEFGNWFAVGPFKAGSPQEAFSKSFLPENEINLTNKFDGDKLSWAEKTNWLDGAVQEITAVENSATYLYRVVTAKTSRYIELSLGSDDGIQLWLNGQKLFARDIGRAAAPDQEKIFLRLSAGENKLLLKINNGGAGSGFYFKVLRDAVKQFPVTFAAAAADFSQKDFDIGLALDGKDDTGWAILGEDLKAGKNRQAFFVAQQPLGFDEATEIKVRMKFQSKFARHAFGHFKISVTTSSSLTEFAALPSEVRRVLLTDSSQRAVAQQAILRKYYREQFMPAFKIASKDLESKRAAKKQLDDSIPESMVMAEMESPRETHLLVRGDFRNKGEKVTPGVPKIFPTLPTGVPANRLALAKWLVDPQNPLVSRVTVNRFWQQYFGTGIVRTADDFGSQGEWPSHLELLDWLATEFVRLNWDIKAMQKLIVMSATYRQDSALERKTLERDPDNRLLARGPRFRFEAETVRDNALAVSGLLNKKMGGPSVSPYQPAGLWEQIAFGGGFSSQSYAQSKGDENYRRGIYTYWKRSMPYASFA